MIVDITATSSQPNTFYRTMPQHTNYSNSVFSVTMRTRISYYIQLVRLHRPIGIFLLMWPALWALWLAGAGSPPWHVVIIFISGVILMRSAGCAINDYADRDFDGHVARTCTRPLATGNVTPREAIIVFMTFSVLAFGLVLMLNWQTILMSVVALLLAMIYPFMKRFTYLPQVFLGAAFGWAVPMAFMAITNHIPTYAWLLFVATIIWALIYDTEYAMVDREDDLKVGIKSTAILFGHYDRLIVGLLQLVMLFMLIDIGRTAELGLFYYIGLSTAAALAIYQQYLIRHREPRSCFTAFLNNNYFGMAIFIGLLVDYLLL